MTFLENQGLLGGDPLYCIPQEGQFEMQVNLPGTWEVPAFPLSLLDLNSEMSTA